MSRILITGSNGFIGSYLARYLSADGDEIVNTYRHIPGNCRKSPNHFEVGEINGSTQWIYALKNVDVVVHLAARVHVMHETSTDPLTAFRQVNTEGTLNLARQASESGVKRFIYLSTIKVNGEQTDKLAFTADDNPNPQDPYAVSKYEAEQQLLELSKQTGMEVVIIRPPLVYGPGVKGNFRRLIKLVNKSVPLPLANIKNVRSLVSIENLCSFIKICLVHPQAAGEIFLVSDGYDLSTSELLINLAQAMGKKSFLFYIPDSTIKFLTTLLGRRSEYERLFGSLQVDIRKNYQVLNWKPEQSVQMALKNCV